MKLLVRASAFVLAVSALCLRAQDALPPAASPPLPPSPAAIDPDLPQPIDFSYADDLVMQSPFTRIVSFDQTYQLTGVAYIDGHPVATVLNKETKKSFVVSEKPNAQGWSLLAASAGADLHQTQVEMMIGGDMIAMHYGGQQLSPGSAGPDGTRSRMAGGNSGKKDGGKIRASAFLGEDGKKLYVSLSPEARDKFKDLVQARVEKRPDLTAEQQAAYAQKVFAKIKAGDQPSAKRPKTPKKKQGA